jgi:hypothetical protein
VFTWRLWRALQTSTHPHPLFSRVMAAPQEVLPWFVYLTIVVSLPFFTDPAHRGSRSSCS